jgi:predicted amidohydrolase YtcJ
MIAMAADLVLTNGKVVTVDERFSIASAVAIKDGRFCAVGSDAEVLGTADSTTRRIDLKGRALLPGFVDGHAHMDMEGLKFIPLSLAGARSIDDVLQIIEAKVKLTAPGEWITTMPIGDPPFYRGAPGNLKENRFPTRWDIDRVSPRNPVYIRPGLAYWRLVLSGALTSIANSEALRLAGITSATRPPWSGIVIDKHAETGEPNGIFHESTLVSVVELTLMSVVPRFSDEDRVWGLKKSMEVYSSFGTTSVFEGHGVASEVIKAYKALDNAGEITVRSHLVVSPSWSELGDRSPAEMLHANYPWCSGRGLGNDLLRIGGVYVRADRSPDNDIRIKAMPYTGWAGWSQDANLPRDRVGAFLRDMARSRVQVATIFTDLLDDMEATNRDTPIRELRWVISHLGAVTPETCQRIKDLGVIVTPKSGRWIGSEGSLHKARLGPARESDIVPLRHLVELGVPFALVSDNIPPSMFHAIWLVVARKDKWTGEVIASDQKLTRDEAVRAATMGGARILFDEQRRGSIEVGKLADCFIASDDPLTVDEDRLPDLHSMMTIVGGRIVHDTSEPRDEMNRARNSLRLPR